MSVRLDDLAVRYMTTRRETDFNALYSEFNRIYSPKYQIKAVSLGLDIHDVQAAHDDALLKTLNIFNPDKGIFSHYLNTAIKNSLTDLMRKNNRWKTRVFVSLFLDKDLLSDVNIENSVINRITDQVFLANLYRRAAEDDIRILRAASLIYNGETLHRAARRLNVCHKTVRRKLQKIVKGIESDINSGHLTDNGHNLSFLISPGGGIFEVFDTPDTPVLIDKEAV